MFDQKCNDEAVSVIRRYRNTWRTEGLRGLLHPIAQSNQDEVVFTGERIVINGQVKAVYLPVLEQHLIRYDWACRFAAGKKVLDAACGAGYGSKMLEDAGASEVVGVDISEESLVQAQSAYPGRSIRYLWGDVRSLPFPDESFDVVVSFETIEHIPEGRDWIRESARLLRPGGLFLVSTPNRRATNPGLYYEERPLNGYHHYEYGAEEFIGELLPFYDLLDVYGQTLHREQDIPGHHAFRQIHGRDAAFIPPLSPEPVGDQLVPLAEIKNTQPLLIVAAGRKKSE